MLPIQNQTKTEENRELKTSPFEQKCIQKGDQISKMLDSKNISLKKATVQNIDTNYQSPPPSTSTNSACFTDSGTKLEDSRISQFSENYEKKYDKTEYDAEYEKRYEKEVNYSEIEISIPSIRPSTLKFNDSGISDLGSSANSVASTPEIEQNNETISKPGQKSKRKNRKSRNRKKSQNSKIENSKIEQVPEIIVKMQQNNEHVDIEQKQLNTQFEQQTRFDQQKLGQINSEQMNSEQMNLKQTNLESTNLKQTNLKQMNFKQTLEQTTTFGQEFGQQQNYGKLNCTENIQQAPQQATKTCKNVQQQDSDINCSVQRNILFDLPLLSIPDENSEEEADEELERFKMYCQETNKLFDLNDSKIVIKWENI